MSQATFSTDLLTFDTDTAVAAKSATPTAPSFFAIRSSLLTLIATGAVTVAGAAGIARISDSVVDSNAQAAQAAAAVPPAEYYEFLATMSREEAAGLAIEQVAAEPAAESAALIGE